VDPTNQIAWDIKDTKARTNLLKHQKKFHIKVKLICRQPMLIMHERDIVQAHFDNYNYVLDELTTLGGKMSQP